MTAAVTTNLALLSAAPGGIKALRQLIFDLAIAGRLLPQQGSDQPAEAVLIATAAMRSNTAVRRTGSVRDSGRVERLPSGWVATTVGDVLICRDGERIPVSQADREIRAKVYDYYGASGVIDKIDGFLFDKPLLLVGEDGANLINRSTPIAFIARGRYWVNNHAHVLDGIDEGLLQYMALYFNAIDLKPYVTGTAQPKLNQAKLNAIPVALPPLAEQHRIVAKVDELMALCDRLEARQQDAEAAHARLVQALLDSLTQARDAEEFQACWQRVAGQFESLLTTDTSVARLVAVVLHLAVSGRLVPQQEGDGSAEDLLLATAALRKKPRAGQLAHTGSSPNTVHAALPEGWVSTTVGEVLICRDGERVPVSQTDREGRAKLYDYYGASGVIDKIDGFLFDKPLLLVGEDGANLINRSTPIAFIARGKYWVNNHAHVLDGVDEGVLDYMALFFNAIDLKPYVTGTAQPKLNQAKLNAIPVLLPPPGEQRRIVAKVTELLALCDQLKARITAARAKHAQLAEALVKAAVA